MKLTIGLSAALAGFVAAAQQAATDSANVYILRGSHHIEPTTKLTPSEARLVLHQRLAPEGEGISFRDLTDSDDEQRIISLINKYGKAPAPLFSDEKTATPRQLVIMVDGVPTFEYEPFFGWLNTQPDFTLSKADENYEHSEIYNDVITKMPACPLSKIVAMDDSCFSGKAALSIYHRSSDGDHPTTLLSELPKLQRLAESGEMQTALVFQGFSGQESDKEQDLRRRQAETVISSVEEAPESPAETSSVAENPIFSSVPGVVPSCFKSEDSCVEATANCSGHGLCQNKYAKGSDACFSCHCLSTKSDSGSVTHWAGGACSKQDISVQFWLFAGFTIFIVLILYLAIGMLFSVGEEKLPGVIGAGVSRSK